MSDLGLLLSASLLRMQCPISICSNFWKTLTVSASVWHIKPSSERVFIQGSSSESPLYSTDNCLFSSSSSSHTLNEINGSEKHFLLTQWILKIRSKELPKSHVRVDRVRSKWHLENLVICSGKSHLEISLGSTSTWLWLAAELVHVVVVWSKWHFDKLTMRSKSHSETWLSRLTWLETWLRRLTWLETWLRRLTWLAAAEEVIPSNLILLRLSELPVMTFGVEYYPWNNAVITK